MDKRPHLVHLRSIQMNLFRRYDVHLFYRMFLDIFLIYLPSPTFRFFKIAVTESFDIPNIRPVARVPVQSMANLRTCSLTFGSHALLVYSSTKLRCWHTGLLQRYTCFPALLCPFLLTCSLPQCGHFIVIVFLTISVACLPHFILFMSLLLFPYFITNFRHLKYIVGG